MLPIKLYYDVGSPYAYLAVERAERVLGVAPLLQPVLLGGLFKFNGRSSWALGDPERRARGMAEVERRARQYGLPPIVWPDNWPGDYLFAMRMATAAGDTFARRAMRAAFAEGVDLSKRENVLALADADAEAPEVKAALRAATEEAHALGVIGVPTLQVRARLFWGDDRLEAAAEVISRR